VLLTPTLIPAHARVEGLIETPADLEIVGRVDGKIYIGGTVTIAPNSTCRADVRARRARVSGELIGSVVCSEAIEITAGAKVVGDLRAPDISIDPHAEIDGRVDLLAPAPESAGVQRATLAQRGPPILRPMPPGRRGGTEFEDEPTRDHSRK
jgi:cytoskeletal protein CcmA (bactofilin family)